MELKDRVIILDEKNASKLVNLYRDIKDFDEMSKIVNRHMIVVIDEIEEDCRRKRNAMAIAKLEKRYPNRRATDFEEY